MKKYLKSYHVFLANEIEQILMYVGYPLVMVFVIWFTCWMVQIISGGMGRGVAMINASVIGAFVVIAELVIDLLVFGGLLNKDTNKLEYLKTSKRGMEVLKKSVIVDKIRRVVMTGAYLCVGYVFCHTGGSILQILSLTMVLCGIIEIGLLLTRRYTSLMVLFVVGTMAEAVSAEASVIAFALPGFCFPIFAALYGLIAVVSHKFIMKKMKKSFEDEAD